MSTNHTMLLLPSQTAETEAAAAKVGEEIEQKNKLLADKKLTQCNHVLNVHYNIELACGPTLYFD